MTTLAPPVVTSTTTTEPSPRKKRKNAQQTVPGGGVSFSEEDDGAADCKFSMQAATAKRFAPAPEKPAAQPRKMPRKEPAVETPPPPPPPPPPPANLKPPTLAWGVATNIGKRPYQEDRSLVVNDMGSLDRRLRGLSYLSVLDGHGGSRCVDFCIDHLHLRLAAALVAEDPAEPPSPDPARRAASIVDAPSPAAAGSNPTTTGAPAASSCAHASAAATGTSPPYVSPANGWMPKKRVLLEAAARAAEQVAEDGEGSGSGDGEAAEEPAAAPSSSAAAVEQEVEEATEEGCGSSPSSSGEIVPAQRPFTAADEKAWEVIKATPAPPPAVEEKEDAEMASPRKEEAPPTAPPAEPPTTDNEVVPPEPPSAAAIAASPTKAAASAAASPSKTGGATPTFGLGQCVSRFPAASDETIGRAFASAFASVDKDFLTIARQNTYGDGSTVLCCLLRGFTLDVANVGDTRCVLGRKPPPHPRFSGPSSGRTLRERDLDAVRLSVDHKPNLMIETERVQEAGGQVKNMSGCWRVAGPPGTSTMLAVSRAIGDRDLKDATPSGRIISNEPQMLSRSLQLEDKLLILATDGLWDVVHDAQAVKIACDAARKVKPPTPKPSPSKSGSSQKAVAAAEERSTAELQAEAAAEALVKKAGDLGSLDNITVLVAWVEWEEEAE